MEVKFIKEWITGLSKFVVIDVRMGKPHGVIRIKDEEFFYTDQQVEISANRYRITTTICDFCEDNIHFYCMGGNSKVSIDDIIN